MCIENGLDQEPMIIIQGVSEVWETVKDRLMNYIETGTCCWNMVMFIKSCLVLIKMCY